MKNQYFVPATWQFQVYIVMLQETKKKMSTIITLMEFYCDFLSIHKKLLQITSLDATNSSWVALV